MTDILAEYEKLFEEIPEARPKDLANRMRLVRPSRDGYGLCMMWVFDVANPMFDHDLLIHMNEAIPCCRCAALEWIAKTTNAMLEWRPRVNETEWDACRDSLDYWIEGGANGDADLITIARRVHRLNQARAIHAGKGAGNDR